GLALMGHTPRKANGLAPCGDEAAAFCTVGCLLRKHRLSAHNLTRLKVLDGDQVETARVPAKVERDFHPTRHLRGYALLLDELSDHVVDPHVVVTNLTDSDNRGRGRIE